MTIDNLASDGKPVTLKIHQQRAMKYELDTTEILVVLASRIRWINGEVSQCPVRGLCSSDGVDLVSNRVSTWW